MRERKVAPCTGCFVEIMLSSFSSCEICRIEEMARRVRFFATQIERERDLIPIRPLYDSALLIAVGPRAAQTMDDLDVKLSEHESRLLEMNTAYESLSQRLAELIEARHVLRETSVFFRCVRVLCVCYVLNRSSSIPLFMSKQLRARSAHPSMTAPSPYSSMTIVKTSTRQSNVQLDLECVNSLLSPIPVSLTILLGLSPV